MEADKFVCKFCYKKYPCGKSLGGHLRSHRLARAAEINRRIQFEAVNPKPKVSEVNALIGSEAYVLRENPKKTKLFADSGGVSLIQERFCKECGKGFQSMKALCGHMACHSEKMTMVMSKFCYDDCSVFDEKTKKEKKKKQGVVVMDSQSDTESSLGPRRGKRSKRVRYKKLEFNSNGSCSSVSEIEQEQEEVAMCLMMLSRDSSGKKSLNLINSVSSNFADQSSDNNSVVLEAKSSSTEFKLINGFNFNSTENSDSGYFRNGPKNVRSDVSVDGFARKCPGFEPLKVELGKKESEKLKHFRKELEKGCDRVHVASKTDNCNSCIDPKKTSESICESGENSIEAYSVSVPIPHSKAKVKKRLLLGTKKSKGHECPICFRVFKSGQALGGHKRSHFIGGSHDDRTVVVLAKQDVPEISGLLDLNLPAPEDS